MAASTSISNKISLGPLTFGCASISTVSGGQIGVGIVFGCMLRRNYAAILLVVP